MDGKNFSLDNGLQADGGHNGSFAARLGVNVGKQFDLAGGGKLTPYVGIAVINEFAKTNAVSVNGNAFNNDLSGARFEVSTGIAANMSSKLQVCADAKYATGHKLEQPWGVNLGVRYFW